MEIPDISEHGDHRPAHPGAPHGKTFPVRIDDHLLLHEQRPSGEDLLATVDKRPCAYELIQILQHDQKRVIAPGETVDLGLPGVDKFFTVHKENVTITIDGDLYEIPRGDRTVADILGKVGKTPDSYALLEEKDGPPLPLPSNQPVPIQGCEIFHTQVQSGGSS
ncbi:MAG: multiubiquitin domain-containing protein [Vicinamibacterales bacterium]